MHMFRISHSIWLGDHVACEDPNLSSIRQKIEAAGAIRDHQAASRAGIASRNSECPRRRKAAAGLIGHASAQAIQPSVTARSPLTKDILLRWLDSERVSQGTNLKQKEFLRLVVDRIMVEASIIPYQESIRRRPDPLIWLLHGPPAQENLMCWHS